MGRSWARCNTITQQRRGTTNWFPLAPSCHRMRRPLFQQIATAFWDDLDTCNVEILVFLRHFLKESTMPLWVGLFPSQSQLLYSSQEQLPVLPWLIIPVWIFDDTPYLRWVQLRSPHMLLNASGSSVGWTTNPFSTTSVTEDWNSLSINIHIKTKYTTRINVTWAVTSDMACFATVDTYYRFILCLGGWSWSVFLMGLRKGYPIFCFAKWCRWGHCLRPIVCPIILLFRQLYLISWSAWFNVMHSYHISMCLKYFFFF